jgi:uncharacterized protein YkwD
MRPSTRLGVVLVALALPLVAACAPTKGSAPNDLYGRVNDIRAQHGAGPLFPCGPLVAAADAHARDMVANNFFGHQGSNGSWPAGRAIAYGYGSDYVGENLAAGPTSVDELIAKWWGSDLHRGNLLRHDYVHVGFASVNGYWVGDFGAGGAC